MRRSSVWLVLCLACAACTDEDATRPDAGDSTTTKPDASTSDSGKKPEDAATPPSKSKLEAAGSLPRPPKGGLPADLRPPR